MAGLRGGAFAEVAARAAGVSPSTFYVWLERGRRGEQPFLEFLEAVELADAEIEVEVSTALADAARNGNWRAAEVFLKLRFGARWRDRPSDAASSAGQANADFSLDLAEDPEAQEHSRALIRRAAELRDIQRSRAID